MNQDAEYAERKRRDRMWYDEMFQQLETLEDKEQSVKMSVYMQNKFQFLGIPKPRLNEFMKPYLQQVKKTDFDWSFVAYCWEKPYREAQYIAIEYILLHQKQFSDKDLDRIKELIIQKSWWETVDSLDEVVGTIVAKYPKLKQRMLEWSVSENLWLRRVAINFQQKYKDKTDTELLERVIENNIGSKEFFINKAIGWSLREYGKANADWVRDYLNRCGDKLAPLSVKEAGKRL